MSERGEKPLGGKCYGSIPHFHGSRLGPGDHRCHWGTEKILTEKARDKHDTIIVTEKLDGSCVGIAKVDGHIVALGRAGWLAESSPYKQHQLFSAWVRSQRDRWNAIPENTRIVGEWVLQAHGTRYTFSHPPFFAFDLMQEKVRAPYDELFAVCRKIDTPVVPLLHRGGPISLSDADALLGKRGSFNADSMAEGVVYRCENRGSCDMVVKYVRPEKSDGHLLPEISGGDPVWLYDLTTELRQ